MEELLKFYSKKLIVDKERIIEYTEEKNSKNFKSAKREINFNILKSEIQLIAQFIKKLTNAEKYIGMKTRKCNGGGCIKRINEGMCCFDCIDKNECSSTCYIAKNTEQLSCNSAFYLK